MTFIIEISDNQDNRLSRGFRVYHAIRFWGPWTECHLVLSLVDFSQDYTDVSQRISFRSKLFFSLFNGLRLFYRTNWTLSHSNCILTKYQTPWTVLWKKWKMSNFPEKTGQFDQFSLIKTYLWSVFFCEIHLCPVFFMYNFFMYSFQMHNFHHGQFSVYRFLLSNLKMYNFLVSNSLALENRS